jgi:hypothetical protein
MNDMALQTGIGREFARVELGDRRLSRRCVRIANTLSRSPERGFPRLVKSESELEAIYRFLKNERVTSDAILAPHLEETRRRAQAAGTVRVLHDTTTLVFSGETHRDGVSPSRRQSR